jgi:hypothetical protein
LRWLSFAFLLIIVGVFTPTMLSFLANAIQGSDNLEHNAASFYELSALDIQGNNV